MSTRSSRCKVALTAWSDRREPATPTDQVYTMIFTAESRTPPSRIVADASGFDTLGDCEPATIAADDGIS